MAELGRKITCSECGVKFYDLGRADVACPKCGHLAQAAEDGPAVKRSSRRAASRATDSGETEEPEELEVAESDDEDVGADDEEALEIEGDDEEEEEEEDDDDDDD